MYKLPDGSFHFEKGEIIPFVCPCCIEPITFDARIAMVMCTRCFYFGFKEEFSAALMSPS